jgi:hypothetical protein
LSILKCLHPLLVCATSFQQAGADLPVSHYISLFPQAHDDNPTRAPHLSPRYIIIEHVTYNLFGAQSQIILSILAILESNQFIIQLPQSQNNMGLFSKKDKDKEDKNRAILTNSGQTAPPPSSSTPNPAQQQFHQNNSYHDSAYHSTAGTTGSNVVEDPNIKRQQQQALQNQPPGTTVTTTTTTTTS